MMKKRLLMSLAVLMGLTSAMATDVITSSDFNISHGETKTFAIKLSNEVTNYVGFQMDLTLPEGLTINKTGCSLSARVADENQVLTIGKQSDNTYRLTSASLSLTPISGTSGDLINVSVTASNTYQGGNATISNIQFATSNSERATMNNVALDINVAAISFADNQVKALCVSNWDTNGDGELDEAEAAAVTDLGKVFYAKNIMSFNELQYFIGLTSIESETFTYCYNLNSVTIPNSVTSIDEKAFWSCSSLTSIEIPNSVINIDDWAFSHCSGLTTAIIPNSVTNIGDRSFYKCSSLTSITIPNSVTSIGYETFFGCTSLASIEIPNSVTSIGGSAFQGCTSLTSIEIPNSVTSIGSSAFEGCTGLTSIDIPNSVTSIGNYALYRCSGLTSINIPISVTSIGQGAFAECPAITSVTIPNSVTSIGNYAFANCSSLTSITVESDNTVYDSRDNCNAIIEKATNSLIAGCQSTIIPNNVTSIITGAFEGCSGLTSVNIPNSVINIGNDAFKNCSGLTSVNIGNGLTSIVLSAFSGCSGLVSIKVEEGNMKYDSRDNCNAIIETASNTLLYGCKNTVIPNSVTSIGGSAFKNCTGLTSIEIPNSVTSIGYSAFSSCSGLTSIEIPNSVTSIDAEAFSSCTGLTSVTISEGVTNIGSSAFSSCTGLTSITIPNSVTSIGSSAFSSCTGLTSITIPNSVTSIGWNSFSYCTGLNSVVMNISSPLTISESTFENYTDATLYVPKNSKATYATADIWKDFKAIKEFPDPDVNQDGYVDVVDVVDVARFVVGTPSESFDQFLADLNGSGEVNVADAVVLVNEIAGDVNWSRPMRAQAVSDGLLTLTRNTDENLSFSLEGNSAYTAFQFDLMMPEEMNVTQMTLNSLRMQNHQLLYNKIGEGHYRIVALSTSNQSFDKTAGELLCMAFDDQPTDDIVIDNIHFVTPQGNDLLFSAIGISGDTPTGISGVSSNVTNSDGKIYNLNGQRLTKAQKGLYIINGKKVLVK